MTRSTTWHFEARPAAATPGARTGEEIARQVTTGRVAADAAATNAQRAAELVAGLAEDADRIGAMIDQVDAMARQIGRMARAPGIGTTPAGGDGRAIAAALGEIVALADQAARATADIDGQMTAMRHGVRAAAVALDDANTAINRSNAMSGQIAAVLEEQTAANATNETVFGAARAAQFPPI